MSGNMTKIGTNHWQMEYYGGTSLNGKRLRKIKMFHGTKREAQKELNRFIIDCEDNNCFSKEPTTLSELSMSYINNHAKRFKKANTIKSDISTIDRWIIPYMGNAKLERIRKHDVQEWVNSIEDSGKSPKTVRNYYSVLNSIMEYGIDMDLIDRNPCEHVRLPKLHRKESKSYNMEEVKIMLERLELTSKSELKFKCFILLALFGGLRKGEILGLDWTDLDGNELTINQTRYGNGDNIRVDTPKTDKSRRTISLPQFLISELNQLRTSQLEEQLQNNAYYTDSGAMIRNEIGQPLSGAIIYRWFRNFCERNDLPAYGLHALRHTHASLLANMGADKLEVSNRLGHSQVSTTLNIYTHLFEKKEDKLASQLDDFRAKIKA